MSGKSLKLFSMRHYVLRCSLKFKVFNVPSVALTGSIVPRQDILRCHSTKTIKGPDANNTENQILNFTTAMKRSVNKFHTPKTLFKQYDSNMDFASFNHDLEQLSLHRYLCKNVASAFVRLCFNAVCLMGHILRSPENPLH